jgi:hypothetical protein
MQLFPYSEQGTNQARSIHINPILHNARVTGWFEAVAENQSRYTRLLNSLVLQYDFNYFPVPTLGIQAAFYPVQGVLL